MKHLKSTYRITEISHLSQWFDRQSQLVGYRGKLLFTGQDSFFGLEMIDGPHLGKLIFINHCRLRRASTSGVCRCPAYSFPHRPGSGQCPDHSHSLSEPTDE